MGLAAKNLQRLCRVSEFILLLLSSLAPYSDSEARTHVLRVRDASLSYTAALHAKRVYQPPPYDPSQMVIDGGLSLFPSIRGPVEDAEAQQETEQNDGMQPVSMLLQ